MGMDRRIQTFGRRTSGLALIVTVAVQLMVSFDLPALLLRIWQLLQLSALP